MHYKNIYVCLFCKNEVKYNRSSLNKYCNNQCQQNYVFYNKTILRFKQGKVSNRRTLKRLLEQTRGYCCAICKNNGNHNGKTLQLQIDHTDGNASNNNPDNVRLLCPNCHSQTDTFVGKNKGKGRQSIGLKR